MDADEDDRVIAQLGDLMPLSIQERFLSATVINAIEERLSSRAGFFQNECFAILEVGDCFICQDPLILPGDIRITNETPASGCSAACPITCSRCQCNTRYHKACLMRWLGLKQSGDSILPEEARDAAPMNNMCLVRCCKWFEWDLIMREAEVVRTTTDRINNGMFDERPDVTLPNFKQDTIMVVAYEIVCFTASRSEAWAGEFEKQGMQMKANVIANIAFFEGTDFLRKYSEADTCAAWVCRNAFNLFHALRVDRQLLDGYELFMVSRQRWEVLGDADERWEEVMRAIRTIMRDADAEEEAFGMNEGIWAGWDAADE